MPRKPAAPPDGGAVTETVREPIKQMTGDPSEQAMAERLPTSTMLSDAPDVKPQRKRRTKEEMAALRGGSSQEPMEDDPLMADPRYKKAVERMRTMGVSTQLKGGFKAVAVATDDENWNLQPEEITDIDDFSYVLSRKYPVMDPTRHWIAMAVYFLALMGTLIFKRAAAAKAGTWMKNLTKWFSGDEEEQSAQEKENHKAGSV